MRYALFQHSLDELDVEAVGDALDEAVPWLARADARMLVRRAYGVLVEGLVEVHARELAQALTRRGVSVERVEQDWLELPPLMACRRADLEPGALRVYDLYGRVTEVPWTRVLLVALGSYPVPERVQQARKPFEPESRSASPWGLGRLMNDGGEGGQVSYEYVDRAQVMLDIVTDAPARYRIQRQRFDYSYLGARREASAAANFPLLVRDVLERAQGAIQNRGARQMRSEAGDMMSYPGPNQFERESAWSLWRFLGPGAGLDAGDPYRSASAMHVRLTAPLARAGSIAAAASAASTVGAGTRAESAAGAASAASAAGASGQGSAKRPARATAPASGGQASGEADDADLDQPSGSRALATRDRDAPVRAPGEHVHVADVSVAVLAGAVVAVAGWWVEPWTMLVALPVISVVYQRMLRRRVQRYYGAAPAADDAAPADDDARS